MSLSRYQYGIWHEKASPAELFFEYHHAARRIPSGQERASRRPRRPAADRALCGPAHGHTLRLDTCCRCAVGALLAAGE